MDGERGRPPPIVKRLFNAVEADIEVWRVGVAAPFECSPVGDIAAPPFIEYEANAADKATDCDRVSDDVGDERPWSPKEACVGLNVP